MAECLLLKCELELQAQCFPQVIEIAHEALETLKAIDASYLSAFHRLMGLAYWKQGDFKSAVVHGQQALSLATASKDKKAKLLAHQNLAHIYIYLDDYDEALSHLQLCPNLKPASKLPKLLTFNGTCTLRSITLEMCMLDVANSIQIPMTYKKPSAFLKRV